MIRPNQLVTAVDTRFAPHGNSKNPNKCFYCPSALGTEHAADCVCRTRTVLIKAVVEYTIEVPESWTQTQILFQRNDGSWCADNMVEELESVCSHAEDDQQTPCLCNRTRFEFVREATSDDEAQGVANRDK